MLADMLRTIDTYNFFDRSDGTLPFLLLDGHHSRLELPFLDYIHEDPHRLIVCIGVPYGTHLWQVVDSEQLNGSFSIAFTKAKKKLYELKQGDKKRFYTSDIIPLINALWGSSFGKTDSARKAIAERGWGPLNYNLLLHKHLQKTVTSDTGTIGEKTNHDSTMFDKESQTTTIVSIEDGESRHLLDMIVADELRNRGKMEAMKKRRLVMDAETDKENALRKCAKTLTSGNLMLSGHTQLTAAVKEKAREMYDKKDCEKRQKEENKARRQAALDNTYNEAKNNLVMQKKLTRKDLTALLKEHHKKGDSPIKKRIEDVRLQWEKRRHRLVMVINPLVPTNTDQSDQLNQLLDVPQTAAAIENDGHDENSTAWL